MIVTIPGLAAREDADGWRDVRWELHEPCTGTGAMIDPADHSSDERTAGADEDESTKDDALPGRPWYDGTGTGDGQESHRGGGRGLSITGCGIHENGDGGDRLRRTARRAPRQRRLPDGGGRADHRRRRRGDRPRAGRGAEVVTIEPRSSARAFACEFDAERIVVGLVDAEGEPIEDARAVLWEATVY